MASLFKCIGVKVMIVSLAKFEVELNDSCPEISLKLNVDM
jgi:hypothetical protein